MGKIKQGKGICLPMAKCAEKCVEAYDPIDSADKFCCAGLYAVNGICKSLSEEIYSAPSFDIDRSNSAN